MADIELVIKIPEKLYNMACNYPEMILAGYPQCIRNGTPLPKGHGELKDVNEIWRLYDYSDIDYTMSDALDDASTIIEADKAESEEL